MENSVGQTGSVVHHEPLIFSKARATAQRQQMKISQTKIMLCNCGKTMPLDGTEIAAGCGLSAEAGEAAVANSLCRAQQDRLAQAMQDLAADEQLLVACTQESKTFEDIADELGKPAPQTVNIREMAGWSDAAKTATPKIAALLRAATDPVTPARSMALTSHGRCLIYGGGEAGLALGKALSAQLGVTVMLDKGADGLSAESFAGQLTQGRITKASGHFTAFSLTIDGFAEAEPWGRSTCVFGPATDGVETACDILIDLSGGAPLFTGAEKRDGYLRGAADDSAGLLRLQQQAAEMIGEFEKPIYVNFDENLCAHSRNNLVGCSRCLDVCPAGAITVAGDHVAIDAGICGGCGMCGSVCPSGAAQTAFPPIDASLTSLANLHRYYTDAGGKDAMLLVHDGQWGKEMIDMLARYGKGLPDRLIPYEVHSVGRVGHDLLAGAVTLGFARVFVLMDPRKSAEYASLHQQAELAEALLAGTGVDPENRFVLIEETDPDAVEQTLWDNNKTARFTPAPFVAMGSPRAVTRMGLRGLAKANNAEAEIIPLPTGAPYGRVEIDTDNCTICLSCVGACPAGALQDNPDAPQLLFREDACLQCGICVATCPEKVISLAPQFNLSDKAMATELVIEDEPFHCTSCGKPFGTTKSIENVIAKLSGHSMFQAEGRTDMLKMCEDCRVEAMFGQSEKMADVGERPKPRTTDDYLN